MIFLSNENKPVDSNLVVNQCHYFVLKCKDKDNTDFYCELLPHIEHFKSNCIEITIGNNYKAHVPFHWSILCSDGDVVESIPLEYFHGRKFKAFCFNPIDGVQPSYLPIVLEEIFDLTEWTSPPVEDKDFLVIPVGYDLNKPGKGPICIMMSSHKSDINKNVGDIIGD